LGHNFKDEPNAFFDIYKRNFNSILKGVDFGSSTLCVQKLLIQPIPPRFFIWESWFTDLPCSFVGPSSLYQRYNLHVRRSYNLLSSTKIRSDKVFKVVLVVRKVFKNMWGSNRTSRNYLNLEEIIAAIKKTLSNARLSSSSLSDRGEFELTVSDLNELTFEQQIKLMAETSVIIGMHGAGMSNAMHMPIGSRFCCGMIEIFPQGEFFPIRGHGWVILTTI
jgi:hypothetical protein